MPCGRGHARDHPESRGVGCRADGLREWRRGRGADDEDGNEHGAGGAGTVLYDAAYLASDELMKPQKGRKALIVLTDGVDQGSKETLDA